MSRVAGNRFLSRPVGQPRRQPKGHGDSRRSGTGFSAPVRVVVTHAAQGTGFSTHWPPPANRRKGRATQREAGPRRARQSGNRFLNRVGLRQPANRWKATPPSPKPGHGGPGIPGTGSPPVGCQPSAAAGPGRGDSRRPGTGFSERQPPPTRQAARGRATQREARPQGARPFGNRFLGSVSHIANRTAWGSRSCSARRPDEAGVRLAGEPVSMLACT
jgi:hypothetical protein